METMAGTEHLEATGWKRRELPGFIGTAGPLWTRRDGTAWLYGILMDAKHLNPARMVHGGALLTLIDHAISSVAFEHCGRTPCVTLQLDTQFQDGVREGEFVQVAVCITHESGSLCFARAQMHVGARLVMSSQSILKKIRA